MQALETPSVIATPFSRTLNKSRCHLQVCSEMRNHAKYITSRWGNRTHAKVPDCVLMGGAKHILRKQSMHLMNNVLENLNPSDRGSTVFLAMDSQLR